MLDVYSVFTNVLIALVFLALSSTTIFVKEESSNLTIAADAWFRAKKGFWFCMLFPNLVPWKKVCCNLWKCTRICRFFMYQQKVCSFCELKIVDWFPVYLMLETLNSHARNQELLSRSFCRWAERAQAQDMGLLCLTSRSEKWPNHLLGSLYFHLF